MADLRNSVRKTWAICEYLSNKLPEGWKIHCQAGTRYVPEDLDNYIFPYTRLGEGGSRNLGIPCLLDLEDPNRAAQVVLHTVWGTHEMGYEYWNSVEVA